MKKARTEILALNPTFSQFIVDMQLSQKPESVYYQEGESVLLDNGEEIILTKELADKLNQEEIENFEKIVIPILFKTPYHLNGLADIY